MNIFGLKILTKYQVSKLQNNAHGRALKDLIELLKNKDKIYLEPVILNGDNQEISNCAFLNCGLTINSNK